MSRWFGILLVTTALIAPASARAAPAASLDLPGGQLADMVAPLSMQGGISISVADALLWQSRVRPVHGRMAIRKALARMLEGTDATPVQVSDRAWQIVRRQPASARQPAVRSSRSVPAAGVAAEAASQTEIVVTASKRDAPLSAYPGMVTVLGGQDLAFGGERGTETILARLASVASTHLGSGRNKLFIRGIADSSFTGPTQSTVGQYVGDIRLAYNAPDPDLRLYDLARVEVLEGPQGTLYGAGSLGGIIRIMPNEPMPGAIGGSVSAGVSATEHGDPGADIGGTLNLPIGADGRHALRVVGYDVSEGGYIDNPLRQKRDINDSRIAGGRVTLKLDLGDAWTVDLGGIVQSTDADDSQYADRDAPALTRNSRVREGYEARYGLGTLVVAKAWDSIRFQSSLGIARHRLSERFDASQPEAPPTVFDQDSHTRMIASETRLWRPMRDGYGWVLGASLLENRTRIDRALGPEFALLPVTGVTNRITEATLYGEASMAITPWLAATGGGRVTRARLHGSGEDVKPEIALLFRAITAKRVERDILPSIALTATPLRRVSLYARYQEGFRPGGLSIESDFVRRFESDRVATIEAGARYGTPGQGVLDAAVSVSHTRWRDIQADFVDGNGLPSTANIGDGSIDSASASVSVRPIAGLSFDANAVYNNGKVTDPDPGVSYLAVARLSRIPNVSHYAARVGVDYQAPLTETLGLHVNSWVRYIGPSRVGIGPVLGEGQGNYFDSALTARIGTDRIGVSLTATNLSDTVGNRFALGTPFVPGGEGSLTPLRPRTVRLGLDVAF